MNTVSLETAVFGGYAIAALAFCLGYVTSRVVALRERREVPAAPPTAVRVTGTGRPSRWPGEPAPQLPRDRHVAARVLACTQCGYQGCVCARSGPQ